MKKSKSGRKGAYRIKLELEFQVVADESRKSIDRALLISVKDSRTNFDEIKSDFLRELLENEFAFLLDKGHPAIRSLFGHLQRELLFNHFQGESKPEREKFIRTSLRQFEKGIRRRLRGKRGRPKTEYSLPELLNSIDVDLFVLDVFKAIRSLEEKGVKLSKTKIAETLFPYNSNPLQAFSRELKKYRLTYDEFLDALAGKKFIHQGLIESVIGRKLDRT